MKKIAIIILVICTVSLGIGVAAFMMSFYGTPWANAQSEQEIKKYLSVNFLNEAVVDRTYYNFENGSYSADCSIKKQPTLKFKVFHINLGNGQELLDDYYARLWEKQISDCLNSRLSVADHILPIITWNKQTFEKYGRFPSKVPNYFSMQNKLDNSVYDNRPTLIVSIMHNFVNLNTSKEEIFDLISVAKNNVVFEAVYLSFKNDKYFTIEYNSAKNVTSEEDVISLLAEN